MVAAGHIAGDFVALFTVQADVQTGHGAGQDPRGGVHAQEGPIGRHPQGRGAGGAGTHEEER